MKKEVERSTTNIHQPQPIQYRVNWSIGFLLDVPVRSSKTASIRFHSNHFWDCSSGMEWLVPRKLRNHYACLHAEPSPPCGCSCDPTRRRHRGVPIHLRGCQPDWVFRHPGYTGGLLLSSWQGSRDLGRVVMSRPSLVG